MESSTNTSSDLVPNETKRRNKLASASRILGIFSLVAVFFLGLPMWWFVLPLLVTFSVIPDPLKNLTGDQALLILLVTTIICPLLLSLSAIVVGVLFFRHRDRRDEIPDDRAVAIVGIVTGLVTLLSLIVPIFNYVLIVGLSNSNFIF